LIIVTDNNSYSLTHNEYINVYIDTIFKDKNLRIISENHIDHSITIYNECDNHQTCFQYNSDVVNVPNNLYLKGYFQCEKYFKNYKREIIDLFKCPRISDTLALKYVEIGNSFFLHYRRGDYTQTSLFNLDHDRYFEGAIRYISSTRGDLNNIHFYVLSDDIEYCKTYPIFDQIPNKTFVADSALNSFYLMSLCNLGGICSNSSFSWWASYLNENPSKTVLFPKRWINNGRYGQENDVYYENTILIDC